MKAKTTLNLLLLLWTLIKQASLVLSCDLLIYYLHFYWTKT